MVSIIGGRMWSGFSSEIETIIDQAAVIEEDAVACGAASHLRLKPLMSAPPADTTLCRMWSGFSSEIETTTCIQNCEEANTVACGAASHLRLKPFQKWTTALRRMSSHVERLLI